VNSLSPVFTKLLEPSNWLLPLSDTSYLASKGMGVSGGLGDVASVEVLKKQRHREISKQIRRTD